MDVKQLIGSTIEMILKVILFAYIIMCIYRAAIAAYDYGYRVFAEPPVALGEGRIISVYVENDNTTKDVAKMLQEKGLIRDSRLFLVQELLSEHHNKIQPGIYDLSTAMTSQEMLAIMAASAPEEEEEAAEN